MHNKYLKIIPVFISIIVIIFAILFLCTKKASFSDLENRYFQKCPTYSFAALKDGTYIKQLENYLTDHFPLRNPFLVIKSKYEKLIGKTSLNGVIIGEDDYLFLDYKKPQNSAKIVKNLNDFYQTLNYVNMNIMLVPTSMTINSDKLPPFSEYNQLEEINYYYENVKFNAIDVSDILKEKNKEYQMFYRLDHHWTTYGAYYAYLEFAKANNLVPIDITDFDIEEVTNDFKGTLYSKVIDNYKSDSIYLFKTNHKYKVEYEDKTTDTLYELSYLSKKDKYALFLDNNHALIKITNESLNNNKIILVIKDSYANTFIPFLTNHYAKVHVIDPRYYKDTISEYVKANNIKDVLVLYNVNNLDSDTSILTIK